VLVKRVFFFFLNSEYIQSKKYKTCLGSSPGVGKGDIFINTLTSRFEVLAAVLPQIQVFWDVIPCRLMNKFWTFRNISLRSCVESVMRMLLGLLDPEYEGTSVTLHTSRQGVTSHKT